MTNHIIWMSDKTTVMTEREKWPQLHALEAELIDEMGHPSFAHSIATPEGLYRLTCKATTRS